MRRQSYDMRMALDAVRSQEIPVSVIAKIYELKPSSLYRELKRQGISHAHCPKHKTGPKSKKEVLP